MKKIVTIFLLIGSLACSRTAKQDSFAFKVEKITLKNGMRFLIVPREGAPVFTGYIRVKVGGIDELPGKTGISHMLEHMAFKGTNNVGAKDYANEAKILDELERIVIELKQNPEDAKLKAEFLKTQQAANALVESEGFTKLYNQAGASEINANTSQDLTTYYAQLPNSKLEFWAFMESERFKHPVFREFYSERDVVLEERRMRVADSPFGTAYEKFLSMAFKTSPYRYPTIGSSEDIKGLTATDMKDFYEAHYSPDNMVGAIVGNVDVKSTKQILEKYFGDLPVRKIMPAPVINEPSVTASRHTIVKDANPLVMLGFQKPTLPHDDDYKFDLLDEILCQGLTSRLYKRMVLEDHIVGNLDCSNSVPGNRATNLYFIYASLIAPHTADDFLRVFYDELQKIKNVGFNDAELARAKKNLQADTFYSLQSNDDLAEALSYNEIITGDWRYLITHAEKIKNMNSEDLKQAVNQYLQADRAIVLELKRGAN